MLVAYWHIFTNGETYRDLGGDYDARRNPTLVARSSASSPSSSASARPSPSRRPPLDPNVISHQCGPADRSPRQSPTWSSGAAKHTASSASGNQAMASNSAAGIISARLGLLLVVDRLHRPPGVDRVAVEAQRRHEAPLEMVGFEYLDVWREMDALRRPALPDGRDARWRACHM
jgi:hypothetical protein